MENWDNLGSNTQTLQTNLQKQLTIQTRELEESRNTARRYRAQVTRLRAGLEIIMAQTDSDKGTEALKLLQKETERHAMDLERETKRQALQIAGLEHKMSNQKTPHKQSPQPHTLDKSTQCNLSATSTSSISGASNGSARRSPDERRLEMVFQIQHTRETRLLACRVMELEDELGHLSCQEQRHEHDKRQAQQRQRVAERTLRQRESEHARVREGLEGEIGQLKVKINSLEGEVVLVCQRHAMWMNTLGCKA